MEDLDRMINELDKDIIQYREEFGRLDNYLEIKFGDE